jgi:PPE-repeat protein
MTAILDFAVLPPEVNSARMYSGAGSGPMVAAASAWKGLAAELRSTAVSYGSLLTALTNEEWHGPASAAMGAAAAPYVEWLSDTAAQAEQTAAQVESAVAAYEAAYAATVAPVEIAANRSALTSLVATNILGQNAPAIAATEAQYGQMWAQDAVAMYAYAGSSASATQLTAFTEPRQNTSPSALTTQAAAVTQAQAIPAGTQQSTLAQLISSVPSMLQGLANPTASASVLSGIFSPSSGSETSGLSGLLNVISGSNGSAFGQLLNANIWNTIFSSGFYMPGNFIGTAADFMGSGGQAAGQAASDAAHGAANAVAGPLGGIGEIGNSVSTGLGRSSIIGTLSVPPSWTAPAPLHNPLSSILGGTPMVAPPPAMAAGMPGAPLGGKVNQAYGRAVPQYGFRPIFVARPPAAG